VSFGARSIAELSDGRSQAALHRHSFNALGGLNELQLWSGSEEQAEQHFSALVAEVRRIERLWSRYLGDSILSKINSSAGSDRRIEVDSETAEIIDYGALLFRESAKRFDLTSGVLRRIWNFRTEQLPTQVPTSAQISETLSMIGWHRVEWQRPWIRLPISGMELDLGGIGKEYAVDRCAGLALERGIIAGLINLGGDVRVFGQQPNGLPWQVGIVDPRDQSKVLATVLLKSGSLATSGDYQRFFIRDGVRYCHIMNAQTGRPVTGFQSVSVLSQSCLIAGSATSLAMLFGEVRGVRYLNELGLPWLAVTATGRQMRGGGWLVEEAQR